jgi:hypothetical protein
LSHDEHDEQIVRIIIALSRKQQGKHETLRLSLDFDMGNLYGINLHSVEFDRKSNVICDTWKLYQGKQD